MAGRKREGISGLKDTQGGNRRDDRQIIGNSTFDPITIDSKSAQTAIYMLQSPEPHVVLRAIAGLEGFARKGRENLLVLSSLKILQYLTPLLLDENNLIRRFAQKLTGMLCSLDEFRDQILEIPNILELLVNVLERETDVVMHEFSALILAELSSCYMASAALLKVSNCVEVLLRRINSIDPDVKKNCLEIMTHLLNDVNGIEAFVESPGFTLKVLLSLTTSSYPAIQTLALENLKQLTSWCRDPRVLYAFRDDQGFDQTLNILEKEDWADLHLQALQLLINVVDSPMLSDYLLQSGYLERINKLLDTIDNKEIMAKIFGVFARISQTRKGHAALHLMEMEPRFCEFLEEQTEAIQESACIGIANMALYGLSLDVIMDRNPIPNLLEIILNVNNNSFLRTVAAYALNVLCNYTNRAVDALLECGLHKNICMIFNESQSMPVEVLKNLLQMFIVISLVDGSRRRLIDEYFLGSIMNCIQSFEDLYTGDTSVQADALECLASYLVDYEARVIFDLIKGSKLIYNLLRSKYASIRKWASHLIIIASQNKSFVKNFITIGGLDRLFQDKHMALSMPTWQKAIDAIFANHLPAKFAYTGRLDFQDITEDGFYVSSSARCKFLLLENCIANSISPICPVYVSSFGNQSRTDFFGSDESSVTSDKTTLYSEKTDYTSHYRKRFNTEHSQHTHRQTDTKESVTASTLVSARATVSDNTNFFTVDLNSEDYNSIYYDSDLNEYLQCLKKRLEKEESNFGNIEWFCIHPKIVQERARIIAEFVAEEMAGSYPASYCRFYKEMLINELKCQLGTNILPLRYIRAGDYLERAMLFKVLADRVGFPCAFVRGMYGRAWIEIAIPLLNIEDVVDQSLRNYFSGTHTISRSQDSKETNLSNETSSSPCESVSTLAVPEGCFWYPKIKMQCFKAYPNYLLKPNAIVDLIEMPGRILRLNSPEADQYRGNFSHIDEC